MQDVIQYILVGLSIFVLEGSFSKICYILLSLFLYMLHIYYVLELVNKFRVGQLVPGLERFREWFQNFIEPIIFKVLETVRDITPPIIAPYLEFIVRIFTLLMILAARSAFANR